MASWGFRRQGETGAAAATAAQEAWGDGGDGEQAAKRLRANTGGDRGGGYGSYQGGWGGGSDGESAPYLGGGDHRRLERCEEACALLLKQETINTLQIRRLRAILMRTWMLQVDGDVYSKGGVKG